MLYINNPAALIAIEEDRRRELGMRSTPGPRLDGTSSPEASRSRSVHNGFRGIASVRYAAS